MIILIYIFMVSSVGLVFFGLFNILKSHNVRVKLPEAVNKPQKVQIQRLLGWIFPTRKLLEKLGLQPKMKRTLDTAHLKLAAEEFFNLKVLLGGVIAFGSFYLMGKLVALPFTVAGIIGFIIPDIWISRKIAKRKFTIARLLPETVDLLGLCVEAGLDFTTAVRWLIEKTHMNPMIEELAFVLEEIKWGKPRVQALKDMSKRLGISEVSSFVQTLVQAERMGTPVAEAFSILSEDTRMQRYRAGERYAMQAPIKILIPLIFCILPVIAIIVGGPIFLQFMEGGMMNNLGVR